MSADELEEQPLPEETRCPECGGDPLPDRVVHNLSSLGYAHDDQKHVCGNCGHEWYHGIPIGDFDREAMADDLWCDVCDYSRMLVHRVAPKSTYVELHLKCPSCYFFDRVKRELDSKNGDVALVGYEAITGPTDGCKPYGYENED